MMTYQCGLDLSEPFHKAEASTAHPEGDAVRLQVVHALGDRADDATEGSAHVRKVGDAATDQEDAPILSKEGKSTHTATRTARSQRRCGEWPRLGSLWRRMATARVPVAVNDHGAGPCGGE